MRLRGIEPTIVVIFECKPTSVSIEIYQLARIIHIRNILLGIPYFLSFKQFNVFFPLSNKKVKDAFAGNIKSFHVLGIFGLILAKRLSKILGNVPLTIGVYHQNEFFYTQYSSNFNRWIFGALCETPWQNMIFFNEANQRSYSDRFNKDFMKSMILPIGIELKDVGSSDCIANRSKFLIVSVGNLLEFKTYNKHVISCLPSLRIKFPNVRYEIYGEGYEFSVLLQYAIDLGVQDLVKFCGYLDYSLFSQVVSRAHVFIGSGTALLESAALGVPSIIGVESIPTAETYGLISDISGYSYNEMGLSFPLVPIEDSIVRIFEMSSADFLRLSKRCVKKAREFNVETLVNGLYEVESRAITQNGITFFDLIKISISFFGIAILDVLRINRDLRFRSNQGTRQ
jgi:1,2-diacylglycerol 3-alpha-glucosyltransferase